MFYHFIDSDDEMHCQRLEIILKSFNRYSCDLLYMVIISMTPIYSFMV